MKKTIFTTVFSILTLTSCLDFFEIKQVYPNKDLSNVTEVELYNYKTRKLKKINSSEDILWYTNFLKDSTNYFKNESIEDKPETEAIIGLKYIAIGDTLDLTFYNSKRPNKVIATFWDSYDPNEKWKYRRYNRFYLNNEIIDSIRTNLN